MTTKNPTAARLVSLEKYAALPEYPRYELVNGALSEQMVASREHERTAARVIRHFDSHVETHDLGEVYGSNRGYVTVPDSPATSRMPDVSFISTLRLKPDILGKLYDGAPDLAVEILSDSNTPDEMAQKIAEYLNAGSKAVWIIDIDTRTLTIHTLNAPPLALTDTDTVFGGDYLPGFACPVSDLLPRRRS